MDKKCDRVILMEYKAYVKTQSKIRGEADTDYKKANVPVSSNRRCSARTPNFYHAPKIYPVIHQVK